MNVSMLSEILNEYKEHANEPLVIKNIYINEMPDIHMFMNLRHLKIINCNLLNIPKMPNILTLDVSNNKLTQLTNIPPTIVELNVSRNNINTINLDLHMDLKILNLSGNICNTLNLSQNITNLDISNTKFVITNDCIINKLLDLKILDLDQCLVAQNGFDNLSDSIINMSASYIKTTSNLIINKLPEKLESLKCINSNICEFKFNNFPSSLTKLIIYNNKLTTIPIFSNIMDTLDISNNNLLNIQNIPKYVRFFDCSGNKNLTLTQEQQQKLKQLDTLMETNITLDESDDFDMFEHMQFNMPRYNMPQFNMPQHNMQNITRLMGGDNFTPSRKRLIRHMHIYNM